jgi:hypothetical protein
MMVSTAVLDLDLNAKLTKGQGVANGIKNSKFSTSQLLRIKKKKMFKTEVLIRKMRKMERMEKMEKMGRMPKLTTNPYLILMSLEKLKRNYDLTATI